MKAWKISMRIKLKIAPSRKHSQSTSAKIRTRTFWLRTVGLSKKTHSWESRTNLCQIKSANFRSRWDNCSWNSKTSKIACSPAKQSQTSWIPLTSTRCRSGTKIKARTNTNLYQSYRHPERILKWSLSRKVLMKSQTALQVTSFRMPPKRKYVTTHRILTLSLNGKTNNYSKSLCSCTLKSNLIV